MFFRKRPLAYFLMVSSCIYVVGCKPVLETKKKQYTLKPPFDITNIQENLDNPYTKSFKCKAPPEPLKDLFFESMYDKESENASIIDPEAYKTYKEAVKPVQAFESGLTSTANLYLRSLPPRPEIAACVASWLSLWADSDALLGKDNHSGQFIRKWLLSSISMAYLQVRDDPYISAEEHEKIQRWIKKVTERVIADFSKHSDKRSRNNNHMYWAAWGVMSAGIALDERSYFDWGLAEEQNALLDIQSDGSLQLELDRGRKAYNYHHFAAIPLFIMAEAAYVNNINVFEMNNNGLERLARLLLDNMENQDYFVQLTGEKQDLTRTITSSNLVWLEIYRKHYKDTDADYWLKKFRPVKQSRVGGNATLLYSDSKQNQ